MRSVLKTLGFFLMAAGLSGCLEQSQTGAAPVASVRSTPYESPPYLPVAYLKPPIRVATNRIQVIERYSDYSGVQPTDFITSPERVARLWAQQRLRTTGGGDTVQFVIEKVGARSDRVGGGEVVTAVLEIELIIDPADGREPASTRVLVDSETNIAGPITPERRRAIYHQISLDMAKKLDQKLSESVQTRLADYLQPKQVRVATVQPIAPRPVSQVAAPSVTQKPLPAPTPARPVPPRSTQTAAPARARVTTPRPAPVADSPLVRDGGKLPSSAWRRGWNWQKSN